MQVITLLSQLNADQMNNQLFTQLDVKEAAILHKYMSAAGHQIQADDDRKSDTQLKKINAAHSNLSIFYANRDQTTDQRTESPQNAPEDDRNLWQRCRSQGSSRPYFCFVSEPNLTKLIA